MRGLLKTKDSAHSCAESELKRDKSVPSPWNAAQQRTHSEDAKRHSTSREEASLSAQQRFASSECAGFAALSRAGMRGSCVYIP